MLDKALSMCDVEETLGHVGAWVLWGGGVTLSVLVLGGGERTVSNQLGSAFASAATLAAAREAVHQA